jgi:molybdopterin synthase sulfur carrier subunit
MLKIHYFAHLREQLGRECDDLVLPDGIVNVAELIEFLQHKDPTINEIFESTPKILVAINQVVVSRDSKITQNDEIAFFPPMTGG